MDEEEAEPAPSGGAYRPLIILDAANIVRSNPGATATLAPLLAADAFWRSQGFPAVVSVLPMGMEAQASGSAERAWAAAARACGALVLVPCRDRGADDLFSISLAVQHDGFLVSNDRYADHTGTIAASSGAAPAAVESWLSRRVVTFAWGGPALFLPHPLLLNAALREARQAPPSLGVWGSAAAPAAAPASAAAPAAAAPAPAPPAPAPPAPAAAPYEALHGAAGHSGSSGAQCRECGALGHARMQCPQLRCFNCNGVGVGHMSSQCPHPRRPPLACWACGQAGHRREACPGAGGGRAGGGSST